MKSRAAFYLTEARKTFRAVLGRELQNQNQFIAIQQYIDEPIRTAWNM